MRVYHIYRNGQPTAVNVPPPGTPVWHGEPIPRGVSAYQSSTPILRGGVPEETREQRPAIGPFRPR